MCLKQHFLLRHRLQWTMQSAMRMRGQNCPCGLYRMILRAQERRAATCARLSMKSTILTKRHQGPNCQRAVKPLSQAEHPPMSPLVSPYASFRHRLAPLDCTNATAEHFLLRYLLLASSSLSMLHQVSCLSDLASHGMRAFLCTTNERRVSMLLLFSPEARKQPSQTSQ